MKSADITLTIRDYAHMMWAYGRSGNLQKMEDLFCELKESGLRDQINIGHISELIFHFGRLQDIEGPNEAELLTHMRLGAMRIYDHMLELNLQPNAKLNFVLVQVCNIDPISVLMNTPTK